ncbi:type II secretion system protein [Candidatus Nomurabacteria bacterium]|nr:type II secretion system protein [Candidatus Nomurabacteria bacterium]
MNIYILQKIKDSKVSNAGYTIIETMIAISLFIIIMMTGMGSLLNANLIHQKSQNMRSIMDGLNFAMEDMSKNLRTGYDYQCFDVNQDLSLISIGTPRSCQNGWAVVFESSAGDRATYQDQWVYYINSDGIFKSIDGAQSFIKLTPDEVVMDAAASGFEVSGAEPPPGDKQQPFIKLKLMGKINFKNTETPFSIQTSISQRLVDVGN